MSLQVNAFLWLTRDFDQVQSDVDWKQLALEILEYKVDTAALIEQSETSTGEPLTCIITYDVTRNDSKLSTNSSKQMMISSLIAKKKQTCTGYKSPSHQLWIFTSTTIFKIYQAFQQMTLSEMFGDSLSDVLIQAQLGCRGKWAIFFFMIFIKVF